MNYRDLLTRNTEFLENTASISTVEELRRLPKLV